MRMDIEDMIAEADKVFTRGTFRGTYHGTPLGQSPFKMPGSMPLRGSHVQRDPSMPTSRDAGTATNDDGLQRL